MMDDVLILIDESLYYYFEMI